MPRGRHSTLRITLSADDYSAILAWHQTPSMSAAVRRRGHAIVLLACGHTITDTARWVGLSRVHTYKWVKRYLASGLAGLIAQPRRRTTQDTP